jgi:hypothetical protein
MPLFKRKSTDGPGDFIHRVEVVTFDDADDPSFVAFCACGDVSPPFPTADEASRWGRDHGAEVDETVHVLTGEGGVGWACMFCGTVIEEGPLRISVHWTDEGVDGEQWYAAHRACIVERMSRDEQFAPQFQHQDGEAS